MHIAIVNNPNYQHEYKWLNDIPSLFYNALLPIMVRYYHFLMALVVLAKVISTKAVLTVIVLTIIVSTTAIATTAILFFI